MKLRRQTRKQNTSTVKPVSRNKEFEAEGELYITTDYVYPTFILDGALLSELVTYHLKANINESGGRSFGKCKIIIVPINE